MVAENKGYTAGTWHGRGNYRCNYCAYSVLGNEDAMVEHVNRYHADQETVRPAEVGGSQARDTGVTQTQTGKEYTTEPGEKDSQNLSERMKEREEGSGENPDTFR